MHSVPALRSHTLMNFSSCPVHPNTIKFSSLLLWTVKETAKIFECIMCTISTMHTITSIDSDHLITYALFHGLIDLKFPYLFSCVTACLFTKSLVTTLLLETWMNLSNLKFTIFIDKTKLKCYLSISSCRHSCSLQYPTVPQHPQHFQQFSN